MIRKIILYYILYIKIQLNIKLEINYKSCRFRAYFIQKIFKKTYKKCMLKVVTENNLRWLILKINL